STDRFTATIASQGYTSGVLGGSFIDRATGARDLGHGLDIADFLLQPTAAGPQARTQDLEHPYEFGDLAHGNIAKRYVELPQICTQAGTLPYDLFRGDGFVAVRQWYRWTVATAGFTAGSLWEQILVFPDGQRYFFSCDRITSANDAESLIFRLDLPGHLKHTDGAEFSEIYLSYEGRIPSSDFLQDFAPDASHFYRRDDSSLPERMIRAYRLCPDAGAGLWLGGLTLDPGDVYEAWCHQRGYVCFIQELGGRPIRAGQRFGAAHVIGFFEDIDEMQDVFDRYRGHRGLEVTGDPHEASWRWRDEP
ncbi:MAG: hypothetical protein HOH74_24805, partial [Gemmatimonadetes bacterium]|nr:hypothetical protein [Gemmatimonadota bacterium]